MFYVKIDVHGKTIREPLADDNVFTRCQECGAEFPVDLEELSETGMIDLYGISLCCRSCAEKRWGAHQEYSVR